MGRNKKGFNWKARERSKVIIDNSGASKISLEIKSKEKYDDCNQFVLPSKKRTTKKEKEKQAIGKILSKKQRKRLEKIVDKKKKKIDRASILESLSQVQATPDVLAKLTSLSAVQTKGLKRHFIELENQSDIDIQIQKASEGEITAINSVSGSKRKKRILAALLSKNDVPETITDPNVVGFVDSSSDDESIETRSIPKEEDIETSQSAEVLEMKEEPFQNEVEANGAINEIIPIKVAEDSKVTRVPAVFVSVYRSEEVQAARMKLPVLAEEQTVMEVINGNDVVIIAGETGSGKTTQLPQFLYEAGFARCGKLIGITQPRRVAAISMSQRVAYEMNLPCSVVSYLIRFEGNCTPQTQIKFMTDGVLLKEMQTDFLLLKYSVIILDEAHERSIYTDILVGLLSRVVPLRKKKMNPLKLIIMSATLRVEDFTDNVRLFKSPPPVVKVESRQYPVSIHFNKTTAEDYLKECFHKTCKIHSKLPEGGILVFVTGQQEVKTLVRKLRRTFGNAGREQAHDGDETDLDLKQSLETVKRSRRKGRISLPEVDLDKYSVVPTDDTEPELFEEEPLDDSEEDIPPDVGYTASPLWVLPLYSLLPSSQQAKVFEKPPTGYRLCVVATNVAETSLTIPHIKYVVDSGRTKCRMYDKVTGVSAYHVTWCSKASANQRAGRAGRVGPGHCYRLYSSAVFNDQFEQFAVPEIQQKPVDDLVLQMKSMNIVKVVNFPFPTSPDLMQLRTAEKRLRILGALQPSSSDDEWSGKLTPLGETMASFPVSPRYGKMLALSHQHDLLQYVVCLVAGLSVQEALVQPQEDRQWAVLRRSWAGHGNSLLLGDAMVLLRAIGAAEYASLDLEQFCTRSGLRHKAMVEIRKLRVQLTNQINLNIPDLNLAVVPDMRPPTDTQARLLRQIMLAGMADQVARKVSPDEIKNEEDKAKWKRAYRCGDMSEPVILHSGSVLKKDMPEWVVFQEVYETNRLYMRGVTAIEPEWLPVFAPSLCNLSDPLAEPPPRFDKASGYIHCHVDGTFGRAAFPLPTMEVPFTEGLLSYKLMAQFLLAGEVCPKLAKFTSSLLSSPTSMTKTWARLQPRTEALLKALVSKEANSRGKLVEAWSANPFYLLEAYKLWLPESAHADVTVLWPPL